MTRSRNKHAYGAVDAGYASSEETFDKPQRREARKAYRKQVRGAVKHFLDDPTDIDLLDAHIQSKQDFKKCRFCRTCFDRCNKPVQEIKYDTQYMSNVEKEQLERFEEKNRLSVLTRYRHVKFK
jgi:hypothetical protein